MPWVQPKKSQDNSYLGEGKVEKEVIRIGHMGRGSEGKDSILFLDLGDVFMFFSTYFIIIHHTLCFMYLSLCIISHNKGLK